MLGLIFLRYAAERFAQAAAVVGPGSDRRPIGPEDYQATGALYLPDESRFETLLNLPEAADIGTAINRAMTGIEVHNPDLKGVLPKDYSRIPDDILGELLRLLRALPEVIEGDGFGLIYEYFLGKFALSEGRKGGEFFTPTSIVRLIVEILEPFHGKIYDPACGTGGMFVQSAHFVERHREDPSQELSIYGQEKTGDTVRLAKMNLAVHGLGGDIREGNTYYEDLHDSVGKFDFVMANPPFNVNKIDKAKLEDDPRFPFGLPRPDNGNLGTATRHGRSRPAAGPSLRRRRATRVQGVVATLPCLRECRCSLRVSAGVFQPRVLRGRLLSAAATASRSVGECLWRSVPLGKYWRRRPLVFSLVPRCHGLWGSQK